MNALNLTRTEQLILAYLQSHPGATARECGSLLPWWREPYTIIESLVEKGLVREDWPEGGVCRHYISQQAKPTESLE